MSVFNKIPKRKAEEIADSPEPCVEPAAGAASTAPSATPTAFLPPETSPTPGTSTTPGGTLTLRAGLERHESMLFPRDGLADVAVDRYELDVRMSIILNAMVAHQSICRVMSDMVLGEQLPKSLVQAIERGSSLGIIDRKQRQVLLKLNRKCNQAKHELGLGSL
jgi:hypothetical protein